MNEKYKVIIIDDHSLFSQSLAYLIGTFENYEVEANFVNGKDFITTYEEGSLNPDLILLDVNMPIMNGIETMSYIKKYQPSLKVLALSVNNDEDTVMKMITKGARGYLLKDTSPTNFKIAMDEVLEKGYYYSEMVSHYLINNVHQNDDNDITDRELEFVKWACTEKTYKEIANEMCISPKTVDGYRESVFKKMSVKTRIGVVLYAIRNNIISV